MVLFFSFLVGFIVGLCLYNNGWRARSPFYNETTN